MNEIGELVYVQECHQQGKFKMEGGDLGLLIAWFNQKLNNPLCVDVKIEDNDKAIMLIGS